MAGKLDKFYVYGLIIICSSLITFFMLPLSFVNIPKFRIGQISPVDIRSPVNLKVKDDEATELKKEEVASKVPYIFRAEPLVYGKLAQAIDQNLNGTSKLNREMVQNLISNYYRRGVIPDSFNATPRNIVVFNPITKARSTVPFSSVLTMSELKSRIKTDFTSIFGRNKGSRYFLKILPFLKPNLEYDEGQTAKLRNKALNNVKPIFYEVRKGEVIVSKGERVNADQVRKIEKIRKKELISKGINKYIAIFLISLSSLFLFYKLYIMISPTAAKQRKNITFSLVTITLDILLIRLFTYFAKLIIEYLNLPIDESLIYVPVITSTIFASIFITKKVAAIHIIPVSVIPSFMLSKPEFFIIPVALGSVFSCFDSRTYKSREIIYKNAILSGISIALLQILIVIYYKGLGFSYINMLYPLLAIIGAALTAIIVNGLVPVFIKLFGFSTDIVYLELANLNNPLLKKLVLKAPGTYNHSVMVATLSEAAAQAIGASASLAKAGGLYHDIGKLKNPQAFVENQLSGVNVHDKLPPEKSALILKSHVEYGVKLAKEYNLPKKIIDIIRQHHGTKLMKCFYVKEKELKGKADEAIFRYPGPKPQFKEAGIVMLADTVEAAVRSVKDKKDLNLRKFIHKLIMDDVSSGQLDESNLSLKDIDTIEKVFEKVLSGAYHNRVEYPVENRS